ncbi:MAG: ketoacyl-ACP synthase III [Rickettsiales bacterium]|nr:ketoacyl-ACP synthase III [Rickettsiales bacterium]
MNAKIIGVGSYLPDKVLTNFDLEKLVDTTDEWITQRTGIHERHIAAENQTVSDMALEAVKRALVNAQISTTDIDMIICATTTPDLTFPSTACLIQNKLGLDKPIIAFDIQAVCSGFVYALTIANDMMRGGKIRHAVIIGADKMSSLIDWKDRSTCVLFGDGAGAVILKATEETGVIDAEIKANGTYSDILKTTGGTSTTAAAGNILMDGRGVFKHAVEKMTLSIKEITARNSMTLDDIALIVPHQANYRILSLVAEKLNIPDDKFMLTIGEHANTSSASIPLALDVALKQGKINKGDSIILEALGGGLTWGAVLIRW